MQVAVTGASGFIGRALIRHLSAEGHSIRGIVRNDVHLGSKVSIARVGDIDGDTEWTSALDGIETVVHLAARTHKINEQGGGDLAMYRRINVDGTARLAEQAAASGVRRIVFLSSIKVNGERTNLRPFTAHDLPAPEDAYGISKWEAEQLLASVGERTGLEVVVVRPPLVYGPGAKGNFARMVRAVRRSRIFPFGAIDNRRSLVSLDNLVDMTAKCVVHPRAAGETFLVSDGEDLSTPDLIRRLARILGVTVRMVPVPVGVLKVAGRMTGMEGVVKRLVESLQVDMEHTRMILDWNPPVAVDAALRRSVSAN